jgi:hypothetical protein
VVAATLATRRGPGDVGDVGHVATWATSPPFVRTLVTLKRKGLPVPVVLGLLPVACVRSQESLEMSEGHDEGQGKGHGAHLDRAGAADTMAPFNPVSNTLGTH